MAPNVLLGTFHIPATSGVWVRIVGVLAFMIGVYAWSAQHEDRPLFEASVYTRFVDLVAFTTFAATGIGPPMMALLGVADLLRGLWTHIALEADGA